MVKRILAATDFSEPARHAIHFARENFPRAEIRLLHVIDDPALVLAGSLSASGLEAPLPDRTTVEREYETWAQRELDAQGGGEIAYGRPADVILTAASEWGADLIALGTRGRRGLARVFAGSVAEEVVRRSVIPVLTAHLEIARVKAASEEPRVAANEAVEEVTSTVPA